MFIKTLSVYDFRNYEEQNIEFNNNNNIIIGNNAQGKTNIIESIYMTSLGKSFRTNKDTEMIKFEKNQSRIKAQVINKYKDEINIEIIINKKDKKIIKINGAKIIKTSEILKNIFIVIFSPEDLRIIKEGPEKRRKFIDRELCQIRPVYYHNLVKYRKIIQQRNKMLKETNVDQINHDLFDVWDEQLVHYGSLIIKDRSIFTNKINEISKKIHHDITNKNELIDVLYEPNINIDIDEKNYKEKYFNLLKEKRKSDVYRKITSVGPHKDDIKILINDIDARHFGSQGQQRTAALSLKLAEIKLIEEEIGEKPILLLDDVLSELDINRQEYLINSLKELQTFITTTEVNSLVDEKIEKKQYYKVEDGKIKKV